MSISIVNVVVPASGDGPIADISTLVGAKTVELSGRFRGRYVLLGSQNDANFVPVATFDAGGEESIKVTLKIALSSVRVRSQAVGASGVTMNVSGVVGTNQFTPVASYAVGTSGDSPAIDLGAVFPPTGVEQDLAFLCDGTFQGQLAVEGSLDGSHFNPIGSFRADPISPSLLGGSPALEFTPLSTLDLVRYVKISLSGSAVTPVVVTFGGSNPASGTAGVPMDLVVTSYTGLALRGLGQSDPLTGAVTCVIASGSTTGTGCDQDLVVCDSAAGNNVIDSVIASASSVAHDCIACVALSDVQISYDCAGCVALATGGPGGLTIANGCGDCVALSNSWIGSACTVCTATSFSDIAGGCQNCVALATHYSGGPLTPAVDNGSSFSFSACGSFLGATSLNAVAVGQGIIGTPSTNCVALAGAVVGNAGTNVVGLSVGTIGSSVVSSLAACGGSVGDNCSDCIALGPYTGMDHYAVDCFAACKGYISSSAPSANPSTNCVAVSNSTIGVNNQHTIALSQATVGTGCNQTFAACFGQVGNSSTQCFAFNSQIGASCMECASFSADYAALAIDQSASYCFAACNGIVHSDAGSGNTDCIAMCQATIGNQCHTCVALTGSSIGSACTNGFVVGNGSGGGLGASCGGCSAICTSSVGAHSILCVSMSNSTIGTSGDTVFSACNANVGNSCTNTFSHSSSVGDNCTRCAAIALGYQSGTGIQSGNNNCFAASNSGIGTNGTANAALAYSFVGNSCSYSFAACGGQIAQNFNNAIAVGQAAVSLGTMGMAFGRNTQANANQVVFGHGTDTTDSVDNFTVVGFNAVTLLVIQAFDTPSPNNVGLIITYNTGAAVVNRQVQATTLASLDPTSLVLFISP